MFLPQLAGVLLVLYGCEVKEKKTPVDVGAYAALWRARHESQPPGREVMRVDGKRRRWENRVRRQYMQKKKICAIIRLPLKGDSAQEIRKNRKKTPKSDFFYGKNASIGRVSTQYF